MCDLAGRTELLVIDECKHYFVPPITEDFIMAGTTSKEKAEIPTLSKFIIAQCSDLDCRAAIVSEERAKPGFYVDSDGVMVRVSPLDGASQKIVPVSV